MIPSESILHSGFVHWHKIKSFSYYYLDISFFLHCPKRNEAVIVSRCNMYFSTYVGSAKYGTLFWLVEPYKTLGNLQKMGGQNYGRVFQTRRQRTWRNFGNLTYVWQIQCNYWKITSKTFYPKGIFHRDFFSRNFFPGILNTRDFWSYGLFVLETFCPRDFCRREFFLRDFFLGIFLDFWSLALLVLGTFGPRGFWS